MPSARSRASGRERAVRVTREAQHAGELVRDVQRRDGAAGELALKLKLAL